MECRMIATGLRHKGPEAVMAAAQYIVDNPHPLVTGFGMAGDERMHSPKDFAAAFDLARNAGLGITVHAGELSGWESVADALTLSNPRASAMVFARSKTPIWSSGWRMTRSCSNAVPDRIFRWASIPIFLRIPLQSLPKLACR